MKLRMNLWHRLILTMGTIWLAATFFATIGHAEDDADGGRVYVLTNKLAGNTVSLQRNQDGSLTRLEEVSTGGLGSGSYPSASAYRWPQPSGFAGCPDCHSRWPVSALGLMPGAMKFQCWVLLVKALY